MRVQGAGLEMQGLSGRLKADFTNKFLFGYFIYTAIPIKTINKSDKGL